MTAALIVRRAGPAMMIQDLGRCGAMAFGISAGGAADRRAVVEGAVLLGQGTHCAVLEMAGIGGAFEATEDVAIALTGAPMAATIDDQPIVWNASYLLMAGQILTVAGARQGVYGYLHVGGGFAGPEFLGSRATHLTAGIGALVQTGDRLEIVPQTGAPKVGQVLPLDDRFSGGAVRVLPSVQTAQFAEATLKRFTETIFTRGARGNRQGVALEFEGAPFSLDGQLTILSEPMMAGDIQMTGEGHPFVLLPECQTTGGYPRIAGVLPDDLPIVAQAQAGVPLKFTFVDHAVAVAQSRSLAQVTADFKRQVKSLVRDPHDMHDLLSYQLISGAVTGWE